MVEGGLKSIVVFLHGLLEGRGIVGWKEVGLPVEEVVLVVMGEDEVDIAFNDVGRI